MPHPHLAVSLLLCLLLVGCGWSNPIHRVGVHKIDIQQGNVITQDMLDRLRPGMTPSQVRYVLGTPLVVDPFRADRWDYVYMLEKNGQLKESRRIAVVFESGVLKGIEGDVKSGGQDNQPVGEARP